MAGVFLSDFFGTTFFFRLIRDGSFLPGGVFRKWIRSPGIVVGDINIAVFPPFVQFFYYTFEDL